MNPKIHFRHLAAAIGMPTRTIRRALPAVLLAMLPIAGHADVSLFSFDLGSSTINADSTILNLYYSEEFDEQDGYPHESVTITPATPTAPKLRSISRDHTGTLGGGFATPGGYMGSSPVAYINTPLNGANRQMGFSVEFSIDTTWALTKVDALVSIATSTGSPVFDGTAKATPTFVLSGGTLVGSVELDAGETTFNPDSQADDDDGAYAGVSADLTETTIRPGIYTLEFYLKDATNSVAGDIYFTCIGLGLAGVQDGDGDGLDYGEEDLNGNGSVDADETDPTLTDTDLDLIADGVEVLAGSDPTDDASVPAFRISGRRIGVNFTSGNANEQIAADTTAGLYPQRNWNNVSGANGLGEPLMDDLGNPTTVIVDWNSSGTGGDSSADTDATGGVGNARLKRGYLDDGNNSTNGPGVYCRVRFVPYARYSVVLLYSTDADGGVFQDASYSINARSGVAPKATWGTKQDLDSTNMVIFNGIPHNNADFKLPEQDGVNRGTLAGIQIVEEKLGITDLVRTGADTWKLMWAGGDGTSNIEATTDLMTWDEDFAPGVASPYKLTSDPGDFPTRLLRVVEPTP